MTIIEFQKYSDDFLTYIEIEKNLSKNTCRSYNSDFKLFITFWNTVNYTEKKDFNFTQIIERYFIQLFNKKIDKNSVARKISSFTSLKKFLKSIDVNLQLNVQRPRIDKKLPTYLSVDEIFYLLDTIKNEDLPTQRPLRDKAIFEVLYATGIRCSELCNISIGNIDFNNKIIRIMGKGRKERIVLFGSKAHEKMLEYLKHERPKSHSLSEKLFVNCRNEPLDPRSIQRIIGMFGTFLPIKKIITPHKIRHSFATHLLNAGVDLRSVQELLGHQSLSSTEKYTHISLEELTTICDTLHPIKNMIKRKQQ